METEEESVYREKKREETMEKLSKGEVAEEEERD